MNISELIKKLSNRVDLALEEVHFAAQVIMEGVATPVQVATFLSLLSMKGETSTELTGFAQVMRQKATHIQLPEGRRVVDTCGTGGDGMNTLNVSTLAALVAAGAGVTVAKHGNRSVSSACGSADVLEKLGVNLHLSPEQISRVLDGVGIAFLFAPDLHIAMKNVVPIRREMGIRTIFNLLGPLTNPANAQAQVVGVFSERYLETVARVLKQLGLQEALVVHSEEGLDEISVSALTRYVHLKEGNLISGVIDPQAIIGCRFPLEEIRGGNADYNAQLARELLQGSREGAMKEVVLLNASAVIRVGGLVSDFSEGYQLAKVSLESGRAQEKLQELITASQTVLK